ncbi:MAG: hypothetical protein LBL92_00490 [Propionibacteriaceae bacterium]|jgi:hypothetical protein|nr:hypothetical protein [Propionibacteriaceae bacterium]
MTDHNSVTTVETDSTVVETGETDSLTAPADSWTVETAPLIAIDPPKIGDFWLDARLVAAPSGVAYLAHEDGQAPAMVILLSQGAAADAAARDRLAGQVNRMHIDTVIARGGQDQDSGRLGGKFRSEDDDPTPADDTPQAPWVALAFDGSAAAVAEAERLLAEVDLDRMPQAGQAAGPEFQLPWVDQPQPSRSRLWPLPWPSRRDRGGRTTIAASFFLMLALAAAGILTAILIFSQSPPVPPQPPSPDTGQSGSGGGSGSSASESSPSGGESSASSSEESESSASSSSASASPTPSSASPEPSNGESASASASEGPGTPTPQLPI